jgi:hypothetical protein
MIGLLTSLALGTTTAAIVRDTSDTSNGVTELTGATTRNKMADYAFLEQNLYLPSGTAAAINSHRSYQFMEQNLYLPAGPTTTAADWRVIEQNSWGEDFTFAPSGDNMIPPSADDVPQQISGTTSY